MPNPTPPTRLSRRALLRDAALMALIGSRWGCRDSAPAARPAGPGAPGRVVIIGAGVAGLAAARELTSRGYILLLRHLGGLRVSDAQCGFKAIRREAVRALVPLVRDDGWFFDSELLLVAQESGYRLREVPVRWVEDRDSRVQVLRTAWRDLRGIWRVRRQGVPRAPRQPAAGA